MIDLRSDTVTQPTDAMRAAMAAARVGDDVYGEDPSVLELEDRTAVLLGKEAAVFVPTGTMSNQVALRAHTEPGDAVVIDGNAHVIRSESGAAAALSGLTMRPIAGRRGVFTAEDVREAIGTPHPFNPTTLDTPARLLCVENTHNGGGGSVWPLEQLRAVCAVAHEHGLAAHLDGARLWHASAASGVAERDFAEPFDTVNVCFSKGLGAPVGSALVGSTETIARARRFKQQFGGGMRQAGILAAGALHALEHHRRDLGRDVANAMTFAEGLARLDGIDLDPVQVASNIVRFRLVARGAGAFVLRCRDRDVLMLPTGADGVRAVFHRDVGPGDVAAALGVVAEALVDVIPAGST